jgi:hypothetical protein
MNKEMIKVLDDKIQLQTKAVAQFERLQCDLSNILASKLKGIGVQDDTAVLMSIDLANTLADKMINEPQAFCKSLPANTQFTPEAALDMMMAMANPFIEAVVERSQSYLESKKYAQPNQMGHYLG